MRVQQLRISRNIIPNERRQLHFVGQSGYSLVELVECVVWSLNSLRETEGAMPKVDLYWCTKSLASEYPTRAITSLIRSKEVSIKCLAFCISRIARCRRGDIPVCGENKCRNRHVSRF